MKKKLVQEIKAISEILPEIYETHKVIVTIPGADANLCVVGASPYDPKKNYQFENPVFLRVNHEERIKDGVKRDGEDFIGKYITSIQTGARL